MPFSRKHRVSLGVQQWCFGAPHCAPTGSNLHHQSSSSPIPATAIDRRATAAVAAWRSGWAQSSVWAAARGPLAMEHLGSPDPDHDGPDADDPVRATHRVVSQDPQLDRLATWAGAAALVGTTYLIVRIAISLITHH